ncbi:MAG TPA: hypothetical protein VJ810_35960 [Blastocatellia bacterium]|nr:hypothetical protein [Blastocatellia bacterium]
MDDPLEIKVNFEPDGVTVNNLLLARVGHNLYRIDQSNCAKVSCAILMNKLDRTLLENILDSLDRLFDRENQVTDVHDILIATSAALAETDYATALKSAADKTSAILRSSTSPDQKRNDALAETDELRRYLSEILYKDSPLTI